MRSLYRTFIALTFAATSVHASGTLSPRELSMAAQQAFQTCHVNLTQNAALDRAAADLLQGYAPDPALARQAYRSTMRRTFRASNYGDLARLGGMLAGRCGFWDGFREYGVATTSGNVAVIVANPDAVDAAQFGTFNRRLLDLTNAARAQDHRLPIES